MDILLRKSPPKPAKPGAADFIRYLQVLLQGISIHAITGDSEGLREFRNQVLGVSRSLGEDSSSEELRVEIASAVSAIEEYNRRAAKASADGLNEWQGIFSMMAETIGCLVGSTANAATEELRVIETNLGRAPGFDDLRVLRGRLTRCLRLVRDDAARIREACHKPIATPNAAMAASAGYSPEHPAPHYVTPHYGAPHSVTPHYGAPHTDSLTQLPGREALEQFIAKLIADGIDCSVALFFINRIASINGRFGRAAGDQVLLTAAQHLEQQLPVTCTMFRWSGPVFAGVEVGAAAGVLDREVGRATSTRLEKDIETAGRSVLLRITFSAMIQRVYRNDSLDLVFGALDKFVWNNSGVDSRSMAG